MSWPGPLQCRAAAVRIDAPPNPRQFQKNKIKNAPELHLAAIFCERKSETVAKHRVTRSKLPFFGWQYPKWRFWGEWKIWCFLGVWGLSGLRILPSYFWASRITAPYGKKVRNCFFRPSMGPNHTAKPRFIEIEIEKSQFLIGKISTPNFPEICHAVPCPPAVQGSGGAHLQIPTVSKKSKKSIKMYRNCI